MMGCWMCGNEERRALFIVKVLEAEHPRDLMALKLSGSWKTTRKQKASWENKDTTDRGLHHGSTVVYVASVFFCSSSLPRTWQLKGIHGSQNTVI